MGCYVCMQDLRYTPWAVIIHSMKFYEFHGRNLKFASQNYNCDYSFAMHGYYIYYAHSVLYLRIVNKHKNSVLKAMVNRGM